MPSRSISRWCSFSVAAWIASCSGVGLNTGGGGAGASLAGAVCASSRTPPAQNSIHNVSVATAQYIANLKRTMRTPRFSPIALQRNWNGPKIIDLSRSRQGDASKSHDGGLPDIRSEEHTSELQSLTHLV